MKRGMPPDRWPRSRRTNSPICYGCHEGYGSELDGLCTSCRSMTVREAEQANSKKFDNEWTRDGDWCRRED